MRNKIIFYLNKISQNRINPPEELDRSIYQIIYNNETGKAKPFEPIFKFALAFILILTFFNLFQKFVYPAILYNKMMNKIITLQNQRNVNKILSLYSDKFFAHKMDVLKNNFQMFFKYYKTINYKPVREKVLLKDDSLIIINKVYYEAISINKKYPRLKYDGIEQIFFNKENGEWKIIAWHYKEI